MWFVLDGSSRDIVACWMTRPGTEGVCWMPCPEVSINVGGNNAGWMISPGFKIMS